MNEPDPSHDLFGELRSLLEKPGSGDNWSRRLLEVLARAREAQGERAYEQRWVPYLEGRRDQLCSPLCTCRSFEEFERFAALVPIASFCLNLAYKLMGDEGAKAIAASPHLAQLTQLNLGGNSIGDEGARALENSPYLLRAHLRL